MGPSRADIHSIVADFQQRALPAIVKRDVSLPHGEGKATVVIGMRRTGKTYRLFQEMRRLVGTGTPKSRILFLNLEDDRLGVPDLGTLDAALESFYRMNPDARSAGAHIFFDEIQVVPDWERFARRVLDSENANLYVTGSSARLLSTEVATHFRGRSLTVEMLPFSMREAARSEGHAWEGSVGVGGVQRSAMDAFIESYLSVGGFPAVRDLNPYDRVQTLQEYVDLVILRDIAERHGVNNLVALRALAAALFSANAGGFSVSKLHGGLVSQGIKVTKATLLSYLDYLLDAYLAFVVSIRSNSARKRAVNPRKVYAIDPGLAAAMYRGGARNMGSQLENAVYLELRQRFGRLTDSAVSYYRTESGREVDFVVDDPTAAGPPELVQVCTELGDPATRAREVTALTDAMAETGATSATIVTFSEDGSVDTGAGRITIVPARSWFFGPDPQTR